MNAPWKSAIMVATRWVHAIQVETWYVNQHGQAQVRRIPLDQVIINRTVALLLWAIAFVVSVLPFGDTTINLEVVSKLLHLAQEVFG